AGPAGADRDSTNTGLRAAPYAPPPKRRDFDRELMSEHTETTGTPLPETDAPEAESPEMEANGTDEAVDPTEGEGADSVEVEVSAADETDEGDDEVESDGAESIEVTGPSESGDLAMRHIRILEALLFASA